MTALSAYVPISATFLVASFILAITPGPGVIYVVTRSASQGRAAGLASAAGIALGNLGNGLVASLGLATLFAVSTLAFTLVKYAGAGYLIYLGMRTLLAGISGTQTTVATPSSAPLRRVFGDGFFVALFNPKTAIFFAAFLPQFLEPAQATAIDALALSAIFVLMAAMTDSAYALVASGARDWLVRRRGAGRAGRFVSGGAFIALGLFTALTGSRTRH